MKRLLLAIGAFTLLSVSPLLFGCEESCAHNRAAVSFSAPTCDGEGYALHSCPDCGLEYKTDLIPPKSHTLVATVTPPDCTHEGFTAYACDCGYTFTADRTPPTGHQTQSATVAPTCTEAGYTTLTCSLCNYTVTTDFRDALGHDFSESVTEPTCTEIGYTTLTCKVCEFSYRKNYLDPIGHDFIKTVAHPTRTDAGALIHTCHCGYVRQDHLFYSDIFTGAYGNQAEVLAKGVDVSRYQHTKNGNEYLPLDWQAVKEAGFDFAILKAGSTVRQTAGGIEPTFEMDYADAKAAGISLGAYFYTYSSTVEGIQNDANLLLSWLEDKEFEYPIYFDLEDPSLATLDRDTLTDLCVTFISILQENGYYAALYSNNDWLTNRLHKNTLDAVYDIWYARYPLIGTAPVSADTTFSWNASSYGAEVGMWQYTDHGVITGIEGIEFDFNYAYKDYPSIIKMYGYNGLTLSQE